MVKRLLNEARSKVVRLCAVEVSDLREEVEKLTDTEQSKHQERQTMPYFVLETNMSRKDKSKL